MEQCSGLFFSGTPDLKNLGLEDQIKREWLAVLNPKCELIGRIWSGTCPKAADFAMPFALQVFEPEGFLQNMEGLLSTHFQLNGEYEDQALDYFQTSTVLSCNRHVECWRSQVPPLSSQPWDHPEVGFRGLCKLGETHFGMDPRFNLLGVLGLQKMLRWFQPHSCRAVCHISILVGSADSKLLVTFCSLNQIISPLFVR